MDTSAGMGQGQNQRINQGNTGQPGQVIQNNGAQPPLQQFYVPEFERPPAAGGSGKIALAIAGLGVLGLGFGVVRMFTGSEAPPRASEAAPIANVFTEQQAMMREAMNMAREAQQMQRERMDMMRQQMMEGERMPEGLLTPEGQ